MMSNREKNRERNAGVSEEENLLFLIFRMAALVLNFRDQSI